MPRFVLLLHECPDAASTHCDLMLEVGSALQTWALRTLPRDGNQLNLNPQMIAASNTVDVERIADHRLAYLEYEGPISGGRGTVRRLDGGEYQIGTTPTRFKLEGSIVRGEIEFTSSMDSSDKGTLTFRPAEPVTDR